VLLPYSRALHDLLPQRVVVVGHRREHRADVFGLHIRPKFQQ
jgi:hypothetical protein